jgi:Tol biopolymer transport system component
VIDVIDLDGGQEHQLIPGSGYDPAWSPDGSRIAFVSQRDGDPNLYLARTDGRAIVQLTKDAAPKFRPAWRPQAS